MQLGKHKMVVRRADERDIPCLLKLLLQVDMVHHEGRPDLFKGPATKYNEDELKALLKDPKMHIFVCVNDRDEAVGHAFCIDKTVLGDNVLTEIKTLYIDDICVLEDYRGQGVGKALYDHVKSFAAENGFYNMTLNVWCCNPTAVKFYESLGMQKQKIGMETIL